ncbi:MAG TPA: site-2 protease family protein [Actinomycetota bacterium]|nr:site-2 protease family protein [Actinomycetota bacterium]
MFGRSWRIATIRGIPVFIDPSWVWIAVLLTYTLWAQLDRNHPGLTSGAAFAYALLGSVLFFGAVFLHEGAHAVAARMNHIEVLGITLVIFGGFTSARVDQKGPGAAFAIAAVGPATSLVLGGLFWWLSQVTDATNPALSGLLWYVGWVNLLMAAFNVLPGLPLDGGRMLQSVVWRLTGRHDRGTRIAAWAGMALGVLLIAYALLELMRGGSYGGIWFGIIGLFIYQGARAQERHAGIARGLSGATVADAMDHPPPAVPAGMTLSEALDRFLRGHEEEAFPVLEDDGRVIGMVSFTSARGIGAEDPLRPVRDAVIPLTQVILAHPDDPLEEVSAKLGTGRAALVLRDGRLVGAITGTAVIRFARTRRA